MINWTQGDLFPTGMMPGDDNYRAVWNGIQQSYHGVSMYPMFYIIGMLFAIGFCLWNFYRKQLSIVDLAIGIIIIIPCSLFGGSFFGKLNADNGSNAGGVGFWGLFAFWHAGMAIHGGVLVGVAVGVITFGLIGHRTKTSLWVYMDAIIPNILLGQAFGRWGNFFNHEVMGAPMADVTMGQHALTWLPHYITTNTQVVCDPSAAYGTYEGTVNGIQLYAGHVYQLSPLFLWESMAFFIAWGLIVFVIPNIGKWIGPKPWKKHKDLYKMDWKQTFLNVVEFWKVPTPAKMEDLTDEAYKNGTPNYHNEPAWATSWWSIWKQADEYNPDYNEREEYFQAIYDIQNSTECLTKKRYKMGKALRKANNPEGYWTTKVGCQACAYFFVWNLTRFSLELQRPDDHLFIMFDKPLSLSIIGILFFLGIFGMVMTQTIAPMFFRQPGYLYEKQYFAAEPIVKHWWISSRKLNAMNANGGKPMKKSKFTIWWEKSIAKPIDHFFALIGKTGFGRGIATGWKAFSRGFTRAAEACHLISHKEAKLLDEEKLIDAGDTKAEATKIVETKDIAKKQGKAEAKLAKMESKQSKTDSKIEKSTKPEPIVDEKILAKQKKAQEKLAKMQEKNKRR